MYYIPVYNVVPPEQKTRCNLSRFGNTWGTFELRRKKQMLIAHRTLRSALSAAPARVNTLVNLCEVRLLSKFRHACGLIVLDRGTRGLNACFLQMRELRQR